jgi:hypothetical protein
MKEYTDLTTACMLYMYEPNEPQRKSVFLAAVRSLSISIGAVTLAQAVFGNKGVQDTLKDKFNLAVIGIGTALGMIKTVQHNDKIALYQKRLEQEGTAPDKHGQNR